MIDRFFLVYWEQKKQTEINSDIEDKEKKQYIGKRKLSEIQ